MNLDLEVTNVFERNYNSILSDKYRFVINQGGTRSSKTYSLCQLLIVYCLQNPKKVVSIVRKSFPALRGSIMRDFIGILKDLELYSESNHNKTENIYRFDNGSEVEFFSVDDAQKLRGRKRDVVLANEANELTFEDFTQLNLRTTGKLLFDFNPSEHFHWLYDLISRENSILIKSTYKDNPFLDENLVKEIENLINIDESYYRIYALGEKGTGKTTIYTHWKYFDEVPEVKDVIWGIDFGYNDPSTVIKVSYIENSFYVEEKLYKSNLTTKDLIDELSNIIDNKNKEIICDSARPEIIEDLKRAGYNAKSAIKNVREGIDSVKSSELFIQKGSVNLIKEVSSYKWKSNGDIILDEPVKAWDHCVDAMRYAIHWVKLKNKKNNSNSFRIFY
jgi:phage terminase large subunit